MTTGKLKRSYQSENEYICGSTWGWVEYADTIFSKKRLGGQNVTTPGNPISTRGWKSAWPFNYYIHRATNYITAPSSCPNWLQITKTLAFKDSKLIHDNLANQISAIEINGKITADKYAALVICTKIINSFAGNYKINNVSVLTIALQIFFHFKLLITKPW